MLWASGTFQGILSSKATRPSHRIGTDKTLVNPNIQDLSSTIMLEIIFFKWSKVPLVLTDLVNKFYLDNERDLTCLKMRGTSQVFNFMEN